METSQGWTFQEVSRLAMGLFRSCGIMDPIPIRGKQMIIAARKPRRIVPKQANLPSTGLSSILSRLLSSWCFCPDRVTPSSISPIHRYFASLSAWTASEDVPGDAAAASGSSGTDVSL